ncbi:MAG: DNA topoisomerase IV subunit A, partial [Cellulomonadaceae bacterium]|nr:DNA topoisomerase IV subunit A [Cellulomonadaceae bacterium]
MPVTEVAETAENVVEIDVSEEMEASFLEYAYSVIYARALPDARDGLKPVQRRILYMMSQMGLQPDRAHVKSARVVGEVMGKLHPHGDMAIYDALVRLSQDFSLRLPLVDGHGNFGSLDDGPAAARYTEARMAAAAAAMNKDLGEDVVDFGPTYDNKEQQPTVLPAAIPNLLVNGTSGIAVGMATNMAPHNLQEVIAAARHLLEHPNSTLEDMMDFIPGPDLPSGGRIVGLEGVREAYRTGRGIFRTRAKTKIENITPKRKGIIVTELPYLVGPEKIIDKVADGVKSKKIQGVTSIQDLTDRKNGLRIVIEVKSGFDPEAVLEQLFRTTPLEESFGINNVALVDGQPQTLNLLDLLRVWVNHRLEVTRRRTEFRLARRLERLHLVEGLLLAIADIDEVIAIIRTSDDATIARSRLMEVFDLSTEQANYILDLQLRRLTKFSKIELEAERDALEEQIAQLQELLADPAVMRQTVSGEMAEVSKTYGTPRRTVLVDQAGNSLTGARGAGALVSPGNASGAGPAGGAGTPGTTGTRRAAGQGGKRGEPISLEIRDTPALVIFSATGLLARVPLSEAAAAGDEGETSATASSVGAIPNATGVRGPHDAISSRVSTTTRSEIGLVTSAGRLVKLSTSDLPSLPQTRGALSLAGGMAASDLADLAKGEAPIGVVSLDANAPTLAIGTASGVVKRVIAGDFPNNKEDWEVISLKDGDKVI